MVQCPKPIANNTYYEYNTSEQHAYNDRVELSPEYSREKYTGSVVNEM